MVYRRNFTKYHAFTLRPADQSSTPAMSALKISTLALYEEFRRRFPEFYERCNS